MTSIATPQYRWSRDGFLRAYEAGAFNGRVELIDGEVWPVVIGDWHGDTVGRLIGLLGDFAGVQVTASSLPTGDSIPDPDFWVRRDGATPAGKVGRRVSRWIPADVLLIGEVSDEPMVADLTIKAALYGSGGYPTYWVITPDVIYEHTEPIRDGYRLRAEHRRGDRIRIPYAAADLPVAGILGESS